MKYLRHIPLIRQLHDVDRTALAEHFLALPPEDRYRRFFRPMPDSAITDWVSHLPFDLDVVFGIYGFGTQLKGVLQLSPAIDGRWELAFSVIPSAQRLGIGEALGRRAIEHLPARGAKEAWLCCMADNSAMRGLAVKLGFSLHTECGETWARLPILPARRVVGID